MPTFSRSLIVLAFGLAGLVPRASAHDTWLLTEQQEVQAGKTLQFSITSGEHFPAAGTPIAPERIALGSCTQGGVAFELKPGRRQAKVLELRARPPAAEGVSCMVRLAPRKLELDVSKVQEYLDEIDAPQPVRDAWKAAPEPRRWVETYTKNAEIIVPGRSGPATASPGSPAGLALRFVTDQNLLQGAARGPLGVTLLRDGKPLAGVSVTLSAQAGALPQRQRSGPDGRVSFPQPAPGGWMLSATDLRLVDAGQGSWESQFATLVFGILPTGLQPISSMGKQLSNQ